MKFFSGFCLENEESLFSSFVENDLEYDVVGFSYGAILALEYCLNADSRIDRLKLLSPAFFGDKSEKYKTFQLTAFVKNASAYKEAFFANMQKPHDTDKLIDLSLYHSTASLEVQKKQLEKLLFFEWKVEDLQTLKEKGILIEVYLGKNDHIVNANKARDFFLSSLVCADVYFLNHGNHLLKWAQN